MRLQISGKEDAWQIKGQVARGKEIDRILGNNLGETFPVVDKLENGKLISIKSVDLNAPTYQKRSALYGKLAGDVRSLERFTEKAWGDQYVRLTDYDSKMLQIAIPKMMITQEQKAALDAVKLYASERIIEVVVTVLTTK